MKAAQSIHIGTSGWHYDHWQGVFYQRKLPKKDFLAHYKDRFKTVEINNTFYQLPNCRTLKQWHDTVPADFIFSVKASRYITHMKKLKDGAESTAKFFDAVKVLGKKLGPILFQLPPHWKVNIDRLEDFLRQLPEKYQYTFEFRDTSWFTTDVYKLLAEHHAAFCIYDIDRRMSPKRITADFIYIRLHGPAGAYEGSYDRKTLEIWAEDFEIWSKQGREIYCYFDNDQAAYATKNALSLQKIIDTTDTDLH